MAKKFYEPPENFIQLRKGCVVFYSQYHSGGNKIGKGLNLNKTYIGQSTDGAQKRIRRTVDLLCQLSPPRKARNPVSGKTVKHSLSFITLTISGKERLVDAKFAHEYLLAPFIRTMRRKHNMITYIWKVEFQKSGQLHYHITTPSIIHYQYIKDTWNNLLSKHGLLKQYLLEHPGQFPNSTDIRSVYKKKDISWYLSKEISKTVQDKSANGKVWDCSLNIKGRRFFTALEPSNLTGIIDSKKIKFSDYCGIYKLSNPWEVMPAKIRNDYYDWRASIVKQGLF